VSVPFCANRKHNLRRVPIAPVVTVGQKTATIAAAYAFLLDIFPKGIATTGENSENGWTLSCHRRQGLTFSTRAISR
jgi:hypothetical protein